LLGSNGLSLNTGEASYYAGGWHDIGSTSYGAPQVQMLPGSYSFAMTYQGTREQLNSQTVSGAASTVTFQAADVVMALVNSTGDPIKDGGGVASYYAGGWHVVGSTNTSDGRVHAQMLPGSYSFAMTYQGTREQLNSQTVPNTANSPVTFQTGTVHSNNNVATSYYASGWKPFTQDMQLLPGNYTFHFSDGTPNTVVTVNGGVVNNIN
jgi:hypothetical protein